MQLNNSQNMHTKEFLLPYLMDKEIRQEICHSRETTPYQSLFYLNGLLQILRTTPILNVQVEFLHQLSHLISLAFDSTFFQI